MRRAQKRVNSLMPVSSKSVRDTRPKDAQKRDWDVSKRLANLTKMEVDDYLTIFESF